MDGYSSLGYTELSHLLY